MSEGKNLKSIFGRAMELESAEERESYLDETCADQPELRAEVEKLLSSLDDASGFMKAPVIEPGATVNMPPETEKPGTRIGPYKLLQQIGEGGMGVVYMAEQVEPVTRRVALKVIKPGMDSKQVIARFEAEEQALAMMDHQNIARVLDAGLTDSGRPYFVMELVRGTPITEFCNSNKLTPQQRLELLIPVCHAIQHAHQKGIIHRDIKPSNVLVTHYDGKPVPKVIDFGVAKATQQKLTEKTMFTQYGQVVGTLEYMSPEQAELSHLDVDTRSDVYSLGILLYELLTGSTPLDKSRLKEVGFEEMLRIVREHEPQKPSTKLSTTMEALPAISAERRTEPKKLGALLKGELDWIVMKSLEKDRTRRYESASGLAADIERFLRHEPVEACPPSATYRFRKFARKHRVVMATASAIVASLVLGVVIATWQAVRATRAENVATTEKNRAVKAEVDATRERDRAMKAEELAEQRLTEVAQQRDAADKARQQSETVSEYLTEAFRSPNPELDGREIKVVEVLDRAVEQLDDSFTDDPNTKARLLHALGDTFEGLGLPREAVKLLEEAQQLLETERGPDHREVLRLRNDLSTSLIAAGQVRRAVELQEATLKLCTTQLGPDDPDTLTAMSSLGEALNASGRYLDSVTMHEDTLRRRQQVLGEVHKETLESMSQLAKVYSSVGRNSEARKLSQRVLTLRREMLGADHLATLESESVLATHESSDGKYDEAIERVNSILSRRRRKLGETHPATLDSMSQLAEIYTRKGPLAEALRIHQDVLALRQKHLGVDHPTTLASLGSIATLYSAQGRLDEGITLKQEAVEATKQKLGALHPATLSAMHSLAETYGGSKRYDDAISLLKEVLKLREQTLGNDNPSTLLTMVEIAWWLKTARQFDEATRFCERALAGLQRLNEADREEAIASAQNVLATIYSSTGRHKEAVELSRENLRLGQARFGESHPQTLIMSNNLAVELVRSGDYAQGGPVYEKAVDLASKSFGRRHPGALLVMDNLAHHYSNTRRYDDAVKLGEEVVAARKDTLGLNHPQTISSVSGLAGFYRQAQAKDKARELITSTLDELRKDHGPEHRATLEMEHQLATDLLTHHKRDEAIQLCEHVLDVRRRTLGADHRETVAAMQRLASAHASAMNYDQAITLREEIISLQEKSLGANHRDTQASRSSLAAVLRLAKRHDEAIAIHEEQLATNRQRMGEDHFDTLSSMYNLATDYSAAGRYDEAIELYEQRVKLYAASLGDAHQFTVGAKWSLVDRYKDLHRFPKALAIAKELRAHFESTLGPTHPTTLNALNTLVWAQEGAKNRAEQIKLLETLLTRQQAKFGEYHEQTLGTANSLAAAYSRDGRPDEAVSLMEPGHELALKHYGPDHLRAVQGARALAEIYLALDRNEEAIAMAREAVSGNRRINGSDSNYTLWSMQCLAKGLEKEGQHAEAGQVYAELAKGWLNKPPRWRGNAYKGFRSSVFNYLQASSLDEAQQALLEAVLLKVPKGAAPVDDLYDQLVTQLEAEGRDDELIPLLEQALKRQPKNAGVHHWLARLIAKQDDCSTEEAERALELATTALQLAPDDAAVLSALGLAHLRVGHWQQAIDVLQQSIDLRVKTELSVGSWVFNHQLAGARVDQALAAIELGKIEQAKEFVHEAEGGLGHWAFFDESVLQDQSPQLREIVKKLNHAREKLSLPTDFTSQERIENTLTAMANYVNVYPDDSTHTMSLQVLLAWFGREQQRTEIGLKSLKSLKAPTTSNEARAHSRIAQGCLIAPVDDERLLRQAIAAARLCVTHGYNDDVQKSYFQSTLAMAEYRSGNYAKADELLTAVVEFDPDGERMGNSAILFRSMARHRLGRHDEAQADLKTIADRFKEFATLSRDELPPSDDFYTIRFALVYHEAKSLFDKRAGSAAEKD